MNEHYLPCPNCGTINKIPLTKMNQIPNCGRCQKTLDHHQGVVELSDEIFAKVLEKSLLPVVVDFWAPWCGPCRSFAPIYEHAAPSYWGKAVFAKLNTEDHQQASMQLQIRSIPTLMLFRNGKAVARQSGAMPESALRNFINPHLT